MKVFGTGFLALTELGAVEAVGDTVAARPLSLALDLSYGTGVACPDVRLALLVGPLVDTCVLVGKM